jgi:phosphohistidine swiveling domain-containing protein
MTLHECFWAERGKLGDVDDVLFEILCRLHELWLDESLDCRDLAWTGGGRRTQAWEDLSDLARADYADDVERQAAFETFYLAHRHLFVRDAPLTERWDILGIREDKDAAWGRFSSRAEEEGPPLREQNAQREEDRQRTVRAILSRLRGLREAIYSSLLEMVRGYRVLVANCHDAVLLCRLLERDVVREVGRRLYVRGATTSVEHARLLGSLEIVNWLESRIATDELVQTISERKEVYRRWQRYAPPPEMELEDRSTDGGVPENALQGQAVSPGVAGGSARIVDTVGEATEVRPGDVLVCHEPLFELSPLFSIVSAVVAEGGGLLDHAGVLVREYRIPAVFGVRGATDSLHEGEPVEVDGRRGLVIPRLPERSDLAADMDALER